MEGPRHSRREERREETRRELVRAARKVFAADGYHGASLVHIAAEAGFTTGAIYWHFGGKSELFLAVVEANALTRVGEMAEIHAGGEVYLADRAREFADQWMTRQSDEPGFEIALMEFFAHSLRHPPLREALATRRAAVRLALARILAEYAEAAGIELPMPALELATVLRELGIGLSLARRSDPEAVSDELFGDFVELFFNLAAPEAIIPEPRAGDE